MQPNHFLFFKQIDEVTLQKPQSSDTFAVFSIKVFNIVHVELQQEVCQLLYVLVLNITVGASGSLGTL